jgi:hypothetical protein
VGSLKTISTLSNSERDDELNNCERLSLPGDNCHQDNLSFMGDNEMSTVGQTGGIGCGRPQGLSFSSSNKKSAAWNNNGGSGSSNNPNCYLQKTHLENFEKMFFDSEFPDQ